MATATPEQVDPHAADWDRRRSLGMGEIDGEMTLTRHDLTPEYEEKIQPLQGRGAERPSGIWFQA
jgi:hypothetical protein